MVGLLLAVAAVAGYVTAARRAATRLDGVVEPLIRRVEELEAAAARARLLATVEHPDAAPAGVRRAGRLA